MIKRFTPILVLLVLLASSVSAALMFDTDLVAIKNRIQKGEEASYNLTIINKANTAVAYRIILPPDPKWSIQTRPLYDRLSGMVVDANSNKTTMIIVNPDDSITGRNALGISIEPKNEPGNRKDEVMIISVGEDYPLSQYLPAINFQVNMPKQIDPRQDNMLEIKINNMNLLDINEAEIVVESDLIKIKETTSVGPKGSEFSTKTKVIPLKFDIDQPPRKDVLTVDIFIIKDGKRYQFEAEPIPYEVIDYSEIKTVEEVDRKFLKRVHTITYTNEGNKQKKRIMRFQTTLMRRMLTYTDPDAKMIKDDDIRYLTWEVDLAPQESTTVKATVNYRPILYIIIIILLMIGAYFYFRSPVVIRKATTKIETKEGGLSDIKIVLHIRNRSPHNIHELKVIDVVPKMAELVNEFQMGVLHPSKILKHERRGTIVKWDIEQLDKFEERILSYRIKSKLAVLGQFSLNPTVARFSVNGKHKSTRSKPLSLSS